MSALTILSATYANAEHSAATIETDEAGVLSISAADQPDLWAAMLAAVAPAPYARPAAALGFAVNAERDRRIALGAHVSVGGQSFTIDTRDERDFRNIQGRVTAAQLALSLGQGTTFQFRDASDVTRLLSAAEIIEMGLQAMAHVEAHYAASWVLKDMASPPADVTADQFWP